MNDTSIAHDKRFVLPNIVHVRATSPGDGKLISCLIDAFRRRGVISRAEITLSQDATLDAMLSEAASAARPEEYTNPNFYRPEVEALIIDRESREGNQFDNPMLTHDNELDET